MSDPLVDTIEGAHDGAITLLAHVAAADGIAYHGLAVGIEDFFLADAGRLDERTRVALARLLRALVQTVEGEICGHGARLLRGQDEGSLADALETEGGVFDTLFKSGVLHNAELIGELLARVRQELLASGMQMQASDEPERPSLINRFAQHSDRVLAQSAMAVLVAESRRRSVPDAGPLTRTDLPAELHHRLVWWVAAALRAKGAGVVGSHARLDRALADAAQRSLAAHDEGDRLEAAVMRLAGAIAAQPQELAGLMAEALGDRRVTLFAALLAHGLGVDYAAARDIAFDTESARLWVALRALGFGRADVARLGVALTEADPRRDLGAFADQLDTIMAVDVAAARDALASLKLPPDYRAAVLALEQAP